MDLYLFLKSVIDKKPFANWIYRIQGRELTIQNLSGNDAQFLSTEYLLCDFKDNFDLVMICNKTSTRSED